MIAFLSESKVLADHIYVFFNIISGDYTLFLDIWSGNQYPGVYLCELC